MNKYVEEEKYKSPLFKESLCLVEIDKRTFGKLLWSICGKTVIELRPI